MKKLLAMVLVLMMFVSLSACTKNNNDNTGSNQDVNPKPDPKTEVEKDVEVSSVIDPLLGFWACPSLNDDFYVTFTADNEGNYFIEERKNDEGKTARIDSVSYISDAKQYRLSLTGCDETLPYDSLLLDTAKLKDGYIDIQNPYSDMNMFEYLYIRDYEGSISTSYSTRVYKYEDIDLNPLYYPTLLLNDDMTFVFTENMYAGMLDIVGEYEIIDGKVVLTIQNQEDLQGFSCEGLQIIALKTYDEDTLVLQTDVCYSRTDAIFSFIEMR